RGVERGLLHERRLRAEDVQGADSLPARPATPLGAPAPARRMHLARRPLALPAAIVLAALVIRIVVVLATPHYVLVDDASDYDKHAASIVLAHRFAFAYGRPTAFRPPAYPVFLAGVYEVFGTGIHRVEAARIANAFVGAGIVALIGVLAYQLWDRRTALVAMA